MLQIFLSYPYTIPHTLLQRLQKFCLQRGAIMYDSCPPRSSPDVTVVHFQRRVNGNIFCLFSCFISLAHCCRAGYRVYHNIGCGSHFHCWPYHHKYDPRLFPLFLDYSYSLAVFYFLYTTLQTLKYILHQLQLSYLCFDIYHNYIH